MNLKKSLATGGIVLSLCGSVLATQTAFAINHTLVAHADQVAPSTTNIEIHKTMYDVKDAEHFENNKIQNDGTQKESTFGDNLFHYNPETMGKIEFTLYDITDVVNREYPDGKGLTGWTASDNKSQQGRINEIAEDIEQKGNKSVYVKDAEVVGTKAIDSTGNLRFENVKAYDASKPQKYHYYVAVETKTPKGFVVQKAKPLVFVNPFTNPEGNGFLNTTYLYPKNKTQKLKFNLTKYVLWNEHDGGNAEQGQKLAGAKFQLYRGKPGEGRKVGDVLTADSEGLITAENLIMGDYYFVEVPSDVANDHPEEHDKASLSPIAKNDKNNKLTFSIDENGIDPTKLQGSLVDYGKPEITKKLTNGIGDHHSLHIGDLAHFNSKVNVPQNIMGSAYQIDATDTQAKSEPYHTFFTRDEPQAHLKDVESKRELVITTKDNQTLQENTDYEVFTGQNKWWVNYIVKDLSQEDRQKLNDAKASHDNETIQNALKSLSSGSVSDLVAQQAGKKLNYEYNSVVTSDAPMDTDIVNDIYLDWNDGSGFNELKRSDKTVTYGVHFVKESSGIMGTGIASTKLQGAKFVVQDIRTGKWFNGWKDAKNTETKEKQAQWVDNYEDVNEGVLTSNENGQFDLQGFTEGEYKLREIKAPEGYQLMDETVTFNIGPNTDGATLKNPIVIRNHQKTTMPLTGSQKLLLAVVGGTIVVTVLGTGVYYTSRKKD